MFVWKKTHDRLKKEFLEIVGKLNEASIREQRLQDTINKYDEIQKIHHIEKEEMIKEMINIKKENDELKKMIYPEVDRWSKD